MMISVYELQTTFIDGYIAVVCEITPRQQGVLFVRHCYSGPAQQPAS